MDYYRFLNKNCENTMKWKDNYERTTVRELEMVNLLPWDVQAGEINTFVLELQLFLQESDRQLSGIHVKVGCGTTCRMFIRHITLKSDLGQIR